MTFWYRFTACFDICIITRVSFILT